MTGVRMTRTQRFDRPEGGSDPVADVRSYPERRPPVCRPRRAGPIALLLCLCALGLSAGATPAEAQDSPARKLGRGFANLGLGVLTLPAEVVETGRQHGPFLGATWGLIKGVTLTAVTEVVGVWEILTAPYEFPPDFKPILSPEFPWQRFQAESRRESLEPRPPPRVR